MFYVTGASGFIGLNFVSYLNELGITDITCIDLAESTVLKNFQYQYFIDTKELNQEWGWKEFVGSIKEDDVLIHLGAETSTLCKDVDWLTETNVEFSKKIIPLFKTVIFASSAAVYGNYDGKGPLNDYARSKLIIDNWIFDLINHLDLNSKSFDDKLIVSLRFHNVYGKHEEHKGMMSSVISKWIASCKENKQIELFDNSSQVRRDFVYVRDVCNIIFNCAVFHAKKSGIYDLGTANPVSFQQVYDDVVSCFPKYEHKPKYIALPDNLSQQYQSYTCAQNENWNLRFRTTKEAVREMIGDA